jgi:hypothetical protein
MDLNYLLYYVSNYKNENTEKLKHELKDYA